MTQPAHTKGLRLAVNIHGWETVAPDTVEQYQTLLDALQQEGASVTKVDRPWMPQQSLIHRCEFREDLERYLANTNVRRGTLEAIIKGYKADPEVRMPYGINILENAMVHDRSMPAYAEAMELRKQTRQALLEELKAVDACLMTGDTNVMHFAGLPSITLPLYLGADGAPRGLILYGADERRLLAAARVIERYCPGVPAPCLSVENGV